MMASKVKILSMIDAYSGFSLLLLLAAVVAMIWNFRSFLLHHPGWMHALGLAIVLLGYWLASTAVGPMASIAASGGFLSFGVSMLVASFTAVQPAKIESKPSAYEIYLQEQVDANQMILEDVKARRMAPLHKELKIQQVTRIQMRLLLARLKAKEERESRDGA